MRVLHVLEATLGGTRRYLENIMDAFDQVPIESGLVYSTLRADAGFHSLLPLLRSKGWSTFQVNMCRSVKPSNDLKSLFQLHRTINAFKPDILHCHSSKAGALGRMVAMFDGKSPYIIYSPHALAVNLRRLYMRVECCLANSTDMFVAVSDSERQQIIDLGLAGPTAVKVVYPCVDANYFSPMDGKEARRRLEFHAGPVVIGVGRLTYQKNPTEFLRVLHRLRAERTDVQAIWVGDGELEKEFTDLMTELQLRDIVRMIPWTHDIRPYLAAADIALSTARFESFGYVVAEAIAMAKPVVATRITGTVDIIHHQRNGLLYELGNVEQAATTILQLLEQPESYRAIQQDGRASIMERFSSDCMRRSLMDTYRTFYPAPAINQPYSVLQAGQL